VGQVADQLRPKVPKLAALMDEAEADVLAFMSFPKNHRPKIHSIGRFSAAVHEPGNDRAFER
jgi:transposase-like protein